MSDTAARSGNIRSIPILVQRDQILTSGRMQKYHLIADLELFSHAKDAAIKVKGPLHVTDDQMNVSQTFGSDHKILTEGTDRIDMVLRCREAGPPAWYRRRCGSRSNVSTPRPVCASIDRNRVKSGTATGLLLILAASPFALQKMTSCYDEAEMRTEVVAEGVRGDTLAGVRVYFRPRVLSMLLLGFSSGLPFLLTGNTLGYWLRDAGTSLTAIGFLSWVGLAYSVKFLWAPIIDRVDAPLVGRFGRRRGWMILTQLLIAIGLAAIPTIGLR